VKYTQKGPCYNARLQRPDGEIIACSTEPLFAACRELVKRRVTGWIRKYRNGVLSAEGNIEQLAGLTIYETNSCGPNIRKWHPPVPMTAKAKAELRMASCRGTPRSPAAVMLLEAVGQPEWLSTEIRYPYTQENAPPA
jgi:hypothetical protein